MYNREGLAQKIQEFQKIQHQIFGDSDPALEKTARVMNPNRSREFAPLDVRKIVEEAQTQKRRGKSEQSILDAIANQYGNNVADMVSTRLTLPKVQSVTIRVGQKYKNPESEEETEIISVNDERVVLKDEFGEFDLPTDEVMNVLANWKLEGQETPEPDIGLSDLEGPSPEELTDEDLLVERFKAPPAPPVSETPLPIELPETLEESEDLQDLIITVKDLTDEIKGLTEKFDEFLEEEKLEEEPQEPEEANEEETEESGESEELTERSEDDITDDEVREKKQELQDVDSVSAEEFGVFPETTIYGKSHHSTNRRSSMDLRNARKERLAAVKGSPDISQEFGLAESDKHRYEKPVPTPYVTEPQLKKRMKRDKDALPEMWQVKAENLSVKFHPKTAEGPERWVVYDGSTDEKIPLFAIYASDDQKDQFTTRDFGKDLLKKLVTEGPQALEDYNSVELNAEKEEAPSETKVAPEINIDNVLTRFKRALNVALNAQNKNLFDSPLKDATFRALVELGIDNPVPVVEKIFQAAPVHFDAALQEATKYFNYDDRAFVEIEAMVKGAETVIPTVETPKVASRQAEVERAQTMLGSVPLMSTSEGIDPRNSIREALPKPKLWGKVN